MKKLLMIFAALLRVIIYKVSIDHDMSHNTSAEVRITDIDFDVMMDAADFTAKHESPYNRPTYRYSPILAHIYRLTRPYSREYLLVLDAVTSYLTWKLSRTQSMFSLSLAILNPFNIVISARGNCDVLTVLFVILVLYYIKVNGVH
ncbi:hypothetical protein ACOME3_005669 [Neoechinorhynchus agilis]